MAARVSTGFLVYRRRGGVLEVLLAHPGGPFFAGKDEGAWTIPKGEPEPGEDQTSARPTRPLPGCPRQARSSNPA